MIYYCVIKDNTLHLVTECFYNNNRDTLTAIAIGTIDEIKQFLIDMEIINTGDDFNELE